MHRERRLVERLVAVWRLTSGDIDHSTPHHTMPAAAENNQQISGWNWINIHSTQCTGQVQRDRETNITTVKRRLIPTTTENEKSQITLSNKTIKSIDH